MPKSRGHKRYEKALKYFKYAVELCSGDCSDIWETAAVNLAHTSRKLKFEKWEEGSGMPINIYIYICFNREG